MNASGGLNVARTPSPSGAISTTSAVQSTWPWTKCPPTRPLAISERSKLTSSPTPHCWSEVLRKVSGAISTSNVCSSKRTTVRQAPLTAIESPICVCPRISRARMVSVMPPGRLSRAAMVPTSSTIPLNILSTSIMTALSLCGQSV